MGKYSIGKGIIDRVEWETKRNVLLVVCIWEEKQKYRVTSV